MSHATMLEHVKAEVDQVDTEALQWLQETISALDAAWLVVVDGQVNASA